MEKSIHSRFEEGVQGICGAQGSQGRAVGQDDRPQTNLAFQDGANEQGQAGTGSS